MSADRHTWSGQDLFLVSEVFFAMGNLLTVSRATYLFFVSESVGPILITLGRMFLVSKNAISYSYINTLLFSGYVFELNMASLQLKMNVVQKVLHVVILCLFLSYAMFFFLF